MERVKVQRAALKEENRVRLLAYPMTHPCVDCGMANLVVLEFDHVRDKRWNITYTVGAGFPWSTIEAEIAKCQVRCANCHRIKTARERGYYDQKVKGQLFEESLEYRALPDNSGRAVSSVG
jgi:5-methylcytosine-specific restriction endonuclease McrA